MDLSLPTLQLPIFLCAPFLIYSFPLFEVPSGNTPTSPSLFPPLFLQLLARFYGSFFEVDGFLTQAEFTQDSGEACFACDKLRPLEL